MTIIYNDCNSALYDSMTEDRLEYVSIMSKTHINWKYDRKTETHLLLIHAKQSHNILWCYSPETDAAGIQCKEAEAKAGKKKREL